MYCVARIPLPLPALFTAPHTDQSNASRSSAVSWGFETGSAGGATYTPRTAGCGALSAGPAGVVTATGTNDGGGAGALTGVRIMVAAVSTTTGADGGTVVKHPTLLPSSSTLSKGGISST
jgi:hypothetical protein